MYRNQHIYVVVPAFNEETQIARVIDTMPEFVDRIVIIDDCSRDRTAMVIREREAHSAGRVHLLEHAVNMGVGGAIATGYKWCRDQGADIAVVMAGDGQMEPADMPALLDPVVDGLADYAKGNRLVAGQSFRRIPKIRFFGNAALSLLTKIASGYWSVADSQTGYTAINADALAAIDWDTMYKRYGQPNDLLVRLNVADMRVIDVPITPVYNVGEKSGIRIRKVVFTIGGLLVKRFFWRLWQKYVVQDFHPLVFFYAFGFFNLAISSLFFLRLLYLWPTMGQAPELTFISWLFALSLGFNSIGFAMWFDYEANRHLNPPMLRARPPRRPNA